MKRILFFIFLFANAYISLSQVLTRQEIWGRFSMIHFK